MGSGKNQPEKELKGETGGKSDEHILKAKKKEPLKKRPFGRQRASQRRRQMRVPIHFFTH